MLLDVCIQPHAGEKEDLGFQSLALYSQAYSVHACIAVTGVTTLHVTHATPTPTFSMETLAAATANCWGQSAQTSHTSPSGTWQLPTFLTSGLASSYFYSSSWPSAKTDIFPNSTFFSVTLSNVKAPSFGPGAGAGNKAYQELNWLHAARSGWPGQCPATLQCAVLDKINFFSFSKVSYPSWRQTYTNFFYQVPPPSPGVGM